jgi:imidazolonepropionase-like amidohydrolase
MNRLIYLLFLLTLPALGFAETQVLAPVKVISMATGEVTENRAIIIEGGTITEVVEHQPGQAPEGAQVIDGQGAWVIPGLAEMHAHIPPQNRGEQHARDVLALFLANGVTTVRGMLGQPWHLELRALLEEQRWPGPRLVTSGPSFNGNSVSSPAQAAQMVREQAAAGYDFLKLHPGLEPDEFAAIADTASELEIPFAGHVSFVVGLEAALRAGQATIDHLDAYAEAMVPGDSALAGAEPQWFGVNLGLAMDPARAPELASATAQAGVWSVPTQSLLETTAGAEPLAELLARPGMEYLAAETRAAWQRAVENMRGQASAEQRAAFIRARRALIGALQEAGAGLLLGSDAPQIMNVPGYSVHQELAYLVASGLTPLQALQSGTINVARFLGRANEGEVAAGQVADLVLLEANPLDDISASARVSGVFRGGEYYSRARLDEMLSGIRERGI